MLECRRRNACTHTRTPHGCVPDTDSRSAPQTCVQCTHTRVTDVLTGAHVPYTHAARIVTAYIRECGYTTTGTRNRYSSTDALDYAPVHTPITHSSGSIRNGCSHVAHVPTRTTQRTHVSRGVFLYARAMNINAFIRECGCTAAQTRACLHFCTKVYAPSAHVPRVDNVTY